MSMMSAMRVPVRDLVVSGLGMKSSNSEIERGSSMALVDWSFLLSSEVSLAGG